MIERTQNWKSWLPTYLPTYLLTSKLFINPAENTSEAGNVSEKMYLQLLTSKRSQECSNEI